MPQLTDQELRRFLLLACLQKFEAPEEAFDKAREMYAWAEGDPSKAILRVEGKSKEELLQDVVTSTKPQPVKAPTSQTEPPIIRERPPLPPWRDQDPDLKRFVAEGLSAAEIAAKLGRTPGAVYVRMSSLGLSGRRTAPKVELPPLPAVEPHMMETTSLDVVVRFLRERDFIVATEGAMYRVDRKLVSRADLIAMANRHREQMRKPLFVVRAA